ncbi:S8 family serine peptidase [Bacteriovoracaceae bacterium]|nr:S8 family serine peptidase [Bacteriovoracaceae bacterium]
MRNFNSLFFYFIFCVLISCEPIYYQDPNVWNLENIKSTKLYQQVNPAPIGPTSLKDAPVKIAVIDTGVNYNHKFLASKISRMKDLHNEQIAIEGYDFLGNDELPYPLEIDFSYLYLATNHQVKERDFFTTSPFKKLHQWNNYFIEKLMNKIKNDENLKNTFFATKINKESINVIGLLKLLTSNAYQMKKKKIHYLFPEKPDEEDTEESSQKLFPRSKLDNIKKTYPKIEQEHLDNLNNYIWYSDEDGLPTLNHLFNSERIDLDDLRGSYYFYQHVKTIIFSDEFIEVKDYFENYLRFVYNKQKNKKNKIYWVMMNMELSSSLRTVNNKFKEIVSPNRYYGAYQEDFAIKIQKICLENKELARNQVIPKKMILNKLNKLKNTKLLIESIFNISDINCNKSYYVNEGVDYSAPFIANLNNDHGTHVSGIIANQFNSQDSIKIVPLKIPLGEIIYPESMKKNNTKYFEDDVSSFLDKFSDYYLDSPKIGKKEFLKKYYKTFNMLIVHGTKKLLQSIIWTRENNIPIANLSLGANYNQNSVNQIVEQYQPYLDEELKYKLSNFFIEYNKSLFRKEIIKSKNTVFIIAAGNDGKIVDGINTHGLPCDLASSPILRKFGLNLPNSSPENVICVQSLTREYKFKDKCSSLTSNFSNKTFSQTTTISVLGENVLSSTNGNGFPILNRLIQKLFTQEKVEKNQAGLTLTEEEEESIEIAKLIKNLNLINNSQIKNIPFNFFSGTSMATPYVTGYFAKSLHDYRNQINPQITTTDFLELFKNPNNSYLYNTSNDCKEDLRISEDKINMLTLRDIIKTNSPQEILLNRVEEIR